MSRSPDVVEDSRSAGLRGSIGESQFKRLFFAIAGAGLSFLLANAAHAQTPNYQGKTLTIIVGS
jgi:hypothetical protein